MNTIPALINEVHMIVTLTEYNYAMRSLFFEGLKTYTSEKLQRIQRTNMKNKNLFKIIFV